MKTLEDLHTLTRLLKEFGLPVSPILEYAINEKEEELLSATVQHDAAAAPAQQPDADEYECASRRPRRGASQPLVVRKDDGTVISEASASDTFVRCIAEMGPQRVAALNISLDRMNIVTPSGNQSYPAQMRKLNDGMYVNTHCNTDTKKRLLERMFKALGLSWTVELAPVQ